MKNEGQYNGRWEFNGQKKTAEWNSPSEAEKAPQDLDPAPEGAFRFQPEISNLWLSFLPR